MTEEPHDEAAHRGRPHHGRLERIRPARTGRPRFRMEMLDAALMDYDHSHRVVTGTRNADDGPTEWIELDLPTRLYANPRGDHSLAVRLHVQDGDIRISAIDVYPPRSLRGQPTPTGPLAGSCQLLWLTDPQSGLTAELVVSPTGRINAHLNLDDVRALNRADVPRLVSSFAPAIDLIEQTIRDTGLRQDRQEM